MEQNKKYGVIDNLTVVYCVISFLIIMGIMAGLGGISVKWWGYIVLGASPFIIDMIIQVGLFTYLLIKKTVLKVKKWFYVKKNPPKKF